MLLCWPLKKPFRISQRFGENPAMYEAHGLQGHEGL